MADIEPEVSYAGMAASLYALGMSHPNADRVEVGFSLKPVFEAELSDGSVATESWEATAKVEIFTLSLNKMEEDAPASTLTVGGTPKGTPEGALYNLQGQIKDLLAQEVGKATEIAAKLEALTKAL
jgi:hypothetical protein